MAASRRQIGVGLVLPAVVVAVWQAVAALGWVNPQVLPSPLAVAEKWMAYLLPLQPIRRPAAGCTGPSRAS
jgi:NitT/TauT family transport system permease protein